MLLTKKLFTLRIYENWISEVSMMPCKVMRRSHILILLGFISSVRHKYFTSFSKLCRRSRDDGGKPEKTLCSCLSQQNQDPLKPDLDLITWAFGGKKYRKKIEILTPFPSYSRIFTVQGTLLFCPEHESRSTSPNLNQYKALPINDNLGLTACFSESTLSIRTGEQKTLSSSNSPTGLVCHYK